MHLCKFALIFQYENVDDRGIFYLFYNIFYFLHNRANNANINFREREKKVLDQILGIGKYDARIRPSGINGTGECFILSKDFDK